MTTDTDNKSVEVERDPDNKRQVPLRISTKLYNELVTMAENDSPSGSIVEVSIEKDPDKKKQIPLRISAKLYNDLAAWAEDDFRSINGQIEYLLNECIKKRKGVD